MMRRSSPWFGSVWPTPNYWCFWTGLVPFVAEPFYH